MLKLPIAKLDEFFAAIAAKETLYLPVDNEGGQAQYKEWKEGVSLSRALNTVRSAKLSTILRICPKAPVRMFVMEFLIRLEANVIPFSAPLVSHRCL